MQAPTKYELVINFNTAKAFSITVSPQRLTRAGEMRITALFAAVHESACDVVDGARSQQRAALG